MDPHPPSIDVRRAPRLTLAAMYTLVHVRPAGTSRYPWAGHIYDISASGMRFELDEALEPGTHVDITATLPGPDHPTITATGRIVRLHGDSDEPGPVRMGMTFERFSHTADRLRLAHYLDRRLSRVA